MLPPINPVRPTSVDRSPYVVTLTDVVQRFGSSAERLDILDGVLRYRAALHSAGLTRGLQWLDGSFVEDIERLERRAPRDLDIVTFYYLPSGRSQQDLIASAPGLFPQDVDTKDALKRTYRIDVFLESLETNPERLVQRSSYWYSLWSHRRSAPHWKGFVQIDLAPDGDALARTKLAELVPAGGDQ